MQVGRIILLLAALSTTINAVAAEVAYHPPNLTIVARDEPLKSVLTALGKEMHITVTSPVDLNPIVSSNIQNQPVKKAFSRLLVDLSYSLQWAENGGRLTGLVILNAGEGATGNIDHASSPGHETGGASLLPAVGGEGSRTSAHDHNHGIARHSEYGTQRTIEHEAQLAQQLEERENRMAQEREARKLEMAEELAASKAQMQEKSVRRKAEAEAYLDSYGGELKR
ncbi:MAG: hypothetical protein Hals2KO_17470 [Halioglobus sp.]